MVYYNILILRASVARQNSRGDSAERKNAFRASALENWSNALERGGYFSHFFSSFSIQYLRLLSAVLERGGKFRLSARLRQAVFVGLWT